MPPLVQIETLDRRLLASLDATLAEAARNSGPWLVCKPGCTPCCIGPFAITELDAWRLREGMTQIDPALAGEIRSRARAYLERLPPDFPGDPATGELHDEDELPASMDDLPCPALNPGNGHCDIYAYRPVTCRTFGPATRIGEKHFGACELCYQGAADSDIIACSVDIDPEGLENDILTTLPSRLTIVAFPLAASTHSVDI